jgi:penicillin G amidase
VALRCTVLEECDLTSPFLGMLRAGTPAAFEAALGAWPGATFNFVWAHRAGAIGYRMAGSVPARAPGEGLLPRDGATSTGPPPVLPPEAMPRLVEPPEGLVVSANNAPGGDTQLGAEWCDRYRAERIVQLLRAAPEHTVASFQSIQLDVHSAPLLALRDALLAARAVEGVPRALLEAWDGQVAAGSAAAAILEGAYGELARTLVTRLAGAHAEIVLGRGLEAVIGSSSFHNRLQGRIIEVLGAPRAPWFEGVEDRDRLLRAAAARAVLGLGGDLGADPARWRWGDLHRLHLNHALAVVPGLARTFSRGPFGYGGDINTVLQGGYSVYRGPASGGFTPAYRQVIDLAAFDRSTFALPGGNSGIPGHPRYDDGIADYLVGRQRPLLYTRAAIGRHTAHRLTLLPASAPPATEAAA